MKTLTHNITLSLLLFFFIVTSCKKDDHNFQEDNATLKLLSSTSVPAVGYNIENSLPKGYVKDGSKDYTNYIQDAVKKYDVVNFPSFPILVNDKGITIGSNKTLNFPKGSELRLKGTKASNYHILRVYKATNVTINNPVIKGDRETHLTNTGEYGSGITIQASSNVTINSPVITECWGDGIYIGHVSGEQVNKNIVINDAYLKKNRRDGITIIAANGLKLNNIYAGYSDGTLPMAGINFEPNTAEDELKNISIVNPKTEYNGGMGIQIGVRNLLLASKKEIDITITDHEDIGSKTHAFKVSCLRKAGNGTIAGTVNIINPHWKKTQSGRPLLVYVDQKDIKTIVTGAAVSTEKALDAPSALTLLKKGVTMGTVSFMEKETVSKPVVNPPATKGYNLEDALPKGYVKNGTQDYTTYVQDAINKYGEVTFPGFPILVNDKGIMIGSNKTLNFLPGSEIRLKASSKNNYHILRVYNASNVTLNNPVVKGDRSSHLSTTDGIGSGISIQSSSNVTINKPVVTDCWGDGIYMGHVSGQVVNNNVVINDAQLKNNRRNGLNVITANGLVLNNVYAGYSNGTLPMTGINFQPNNEEDELKNIVLNNPKTEYNGEMGIQIGVRNMLLASRKDIDITIRNHDDLASKLYALKVSCLRKSGSGSIYGTINVINPTWKNVQTGKPVLVYMDQKNVITSITKPTVTNNNSILNSAQAIALLNSGVSMGTLTVK